MTKSTQEPMPMLPRFRKDVYFQTDFLINKAWRPVNSIFWCFDDGYLFLERVHLRGQHLCKFIQQKKALYKKRVQLLQDWFETANMTAVPLFWNTNMAAMTSGFRISYTYRMRTHTKRCFHFRLKKYSKVMLKINWSIV